MAADKIEVKKGVPLTWTLEFEDENGIPYDLTGKTIMFTVKYQDDVLDNDTTAIIQKNITSHSDPTNGTTVITLTAVDTAIAIGDYKYDIRIYQASPELILNSDAGQFVVTDIVTKRTS